MATGQTLTAEDMTDLNSLLYVISAPVESSLSREDAATRRLCGILESSLLAMRTMHDPDSRPNKPLTQDRVNAIKHAKHVALKYAADAALNRMAQMVVSEVASLPAPAIPEDSECPCLERLGLYDVTDFLTAYRDTNLVSAMADADRDGALQTFTRLSAKFARILQAAGETYTASTASRLARHAVALGQ
jgi:hypothetical protein